MTAQQPYLSTSWKSLDWRILAASPILLHLFKVFWMVQTRFNLAHVLFSLLYYCPTTGCDTCSQPHQPYTRRDLNTNVPLPRATLAHKNCWHGYGMQEQWRDHFPFSSKAGLLYFVPKLKALPTWVKSSLWEKGICIKQWASDFGFPKRRLIQHETGWEHRRQLLMTDNSNLRFGAIPSTPVQ